MMQTHQSLKSYNTFGLDIYANEYISIRDEETITDLAPIEKPFLILGGGSNILFTKDFDGLLLHNHIKGIEIVKEDASCVHVRVGGGENWHQFVLWCLKKNLGGIENLALIPGTVGAAPIQNIGAYGVELKDVFNKLEAIDLQTGTKKSFSKEQCQFGYRYSIFKGEMKGRFFISHVYLTLQKKHTLHLSYGSIKETMNQLKLEQTIQGVADAVMSIRRQKLPDPEKIGNAGSFFKNPVISVEQFNKIKDKYDSVPHYPAGDEIKVPAAWLIDQLGWKGHRRDDAGVHTRQALVLVNHGTANGAELFQLAKDIQSDVSTTFNIELEMEVNIM